MSSRSKQRPKERKGGAAVVHPVPTTEDLKPQLLGFSFYLLGTGCVAMGLGQLLWFALIRHADIPPMLVGWALPLGQVMGVLGLLLAWAVTKGRQRWMMGAGTILWVGLFVLAMARNQVQRWLSPHGVLAVVLATEVLPWVGSAIVLGLAAFVVHGAAQKYGGRTWTTVLGLALLVAHAFELAWATLVPSGHETTLFVLRNSQVGVAGLLLLGVGMFAVGRRHLPDEPPPGQPRRGPVLVPANERPSLLADAIVALAGVTFALAASVAAAGPLGSSSVETAQLAGTGGFVASSVLLFVALRREPEHAAGPARFALAAVVSTALYLVGLFVVSRHDGSMTRGLSNGLLVLPVLLGSAAIYATATAQTGKDPRVRVERDARRRVTAASLGFAMLMIALGLFLGEGDAAFAAAAVAALASGVGFFRSLKPG